MRRIVLAPLFCSLLVAFPACTKRETAQPVTSTIQETTQDQIDVCGLITKQEIEAIQGSPIKETKGSVRSDAGFHVSQCFYTAAEFSKSVSLAVTQSDPTLPGKRSPRDFWKDTFGRYGGEEKQSEGDKDKQESVRDQARRGGEEKESIPPKKIKSIGEEAYWASNPMGGALYVLKKNAFIRIGLGGTNNEEAKIEKSKALAQKALDRL